MMTHSEVAAHFNSTLPTYYLYPDKPIWELVPCITYKLSEAGPENRRQLTVYIDLWCSIPTYLENTEKVNTLIANLRRKSAGPTWTDYCDPSITLSDGTVGLAHRSYVFILN
jgi:hypothetical protein